MAPGIGASGVMGLALETTPLTYEAPTKFFPFTSENLQYQQATNFRRPIRNTAGILGAVPGDVHTEGDINMEALTDVVPYFLLAARTAVTKTGTSAPFTYDFVPTSSAVPDKTLSITIVRNGIVHGYTGLVVGSFTFTIEEGMLMFNVSLVGSDEEVQNAPTPTWTDSTPFGAGQFDLQIPTSTQVFDTDNFEFVVEDNAEPQYRLKNTGRGAQFVKFGEHTATLTVERDFEDRTDYDNYKALTAQSVTLMATKDGGDNAISLNLPASIKETYEVGLSGQGDLVRASVAYQAVLDATGKDYTISVTTSEDITVD